MRGILQVHNYHDHSQNVKDNSSQLLNTWVESLSKPADE